MVVVVLAVTAIGGLGWYFFAPRRAIAAVEYGGVQRLAVTVHGGYSPNVLKVRQGVPVEIEFDRQETGDCSARVVFPELQVSAPLRAHQRTTVRFIPQQIGSFDFACGMNMIHGTLVITPDERHCRGPRAGPARHHVSAIRS